MRAVDIIEKKRNGLELTNEEIEFLINGYTNGIIPDYQMSAFTMAVYFQGMTDNEATNLALAMLHSGDELNLDMIEGVKVDKHSTGGVGDKTSLVLAPLVASLGINFAKMSGRGLGHTGGTLDKLESIPGFNISLTDEEFIEQVKKIHLSIIGQTVNLAPADKKLYSLRDVTATVDSIPLIASSIMSKKLASGANAICLDVKVGSGAFMKNIDSARKLAKLMVAIGNKCNRHMTAILTNMDEPLGFAVGNSLEVIEAIKTLNGEGPKDLLELCLTLGAYLVIDSNLAVTVSEAKEILRKQIENKAGLNKLAEMVSAQGGDSSYIYDYKKFALGKNIIEIKSTDNGYISKIDALAIGHAAMLVGAGREKITDAINPRVGVLLNKKVGDFVKENETIATLYSDGHNENEAIEMIKRAYSYADVEVEPKLILEIIR